MEPNSDSHVFLQHSNDFNQSEQNVRLPIQPIGYGVINRARPIEISMPYHQRFGEEWMFTTPQNDFRNKTVPVSLPKTNVNDDLAYDSPGNVNLEPSNDVDQFNTQSRNDSDDGLSEFYKIWNTASNSLDNFSIPWNDDPNIASYREYGLGNETTKQNFELAYEISREGRNLLNQAMSIHNDIITNQKTKTQVQEPPTTNYLPNGPINGSLQDLPFHSSGSHTIPKQHWINSSHYPSSTLSSITRPPPGFNECFRMDIPNFAKSYPYKMQFQQPIGYYKVPINYVGIPSQPVPKVYLPIPPQEYQTLGIDKVMKPTTVEYQIVEPHYEQMYFQKKSTSGNNVVKSCAFCRTNKEMFKFASSHYLYDPITNEILCPVLRKHVCKICGATGGKAHTESYCNLNTNKTWVSNGRIATRHLSSGAINLRYHQ